MRLKPVSGLWIGNKLSYIEKLCIRSILDAGHDYRLYSYTPVNGESLGAEVRDASSILPLKVEPSLLTYDEIEIVADRFKYRLLQIENTIYADLDMYCLRPWSFSDPYLMCWQKGTRVVGGAVFAAPKDSAFLGALAEYSMNPTPVPPWFDEEDQENLRSLVEEGRGIPAEGLKRGVLGVHAISYFAKQFQLRGRILERSLFFPCEFSERDQLTSPRDDLTGRLGRSYGVHLWGRRLRRSVMSGEMRVPSENSFFGKALAKHGVTVVEAASEKTSPGGLIKQNTPVEELDATELRRAMRELENKARRKFEPLVRPPDLPSSDANLLIVSAMKNEGPFILEWVAYHLSIGVKHFLVYTNDCSDGTVQILNRLQEMGHVTRLDNPYKKDKGQKPQRGALNDAVKQDVLKDSDWVMCLDVDEFINIHVGDGTIRCLLEAANYPNLISLTWKFFGNDGVHKFSDKLVSEQFLRCAPEYLPKPRLGWGFKTMFSKDAPYSKLGVHRPLHPDLSQIDKARWVNGSGRIMPEMLLTNNGWRSTKRTIGYSMATLNHYVLRSAESFLVKRDRGRINHVDQDQGIEYWQARNYINDFDDRILARIPRAKEWLNSLLEDQILAKYHMRAVRWHKARIAELMSQPDYAELYERIIASDPLAAKREEQTNYSP